MVKKINWILCFLFIIPLGLFAQNEFKISGKIDNVATGKEVAIYVLSKEKILLINSKIQENGKYELSAKIDEAGFYFMTVDDDQRIDLILHPGDEIILNADVNKLPESIIVDGSESTALLFEIGNYVTPIYKELEQLKNQYSNTEDKAEQQVIIDKFASAKTKMDDKVSQYMLNYSSSLACVFYIERLEAKKYPESYKRVTTQLYKKYPNNQYVIDLYNKIKSVDNTAIGAIAPELAFANPSGEIIKLSSLRGKVVLIDFWASWCGPCRGENPNVVKVYKEYKDKGFEIYSVSLDKNRDKWIKAIEDDNLIWKSHVSDLKYWNAAGAKLYGVSSIPATFLIDKDGKIIAKNLRGKALEDKLKEILGE